MRSAAPPSVPPSADVDDIDDDHEPSTVVPAAALTNADDSGYELVLEHRSGWVAVDWAELWRHRELLGFLIWRDVKVRYKQAILGFAWAVLAPLMNVAILTLIFGEAAGLRSRVPAGIPYSLYVFAGLIPWQLIAASISQGGMSLVGQQNLLSKIYLPRLFIPAGVVGSALFDLAIACVVFTGLMLWHGITPAWTTLLVLPLIALTALAGLAISITISALTVTYRDLRFILPFLVQLLMLLSAVGFPPSTFASRPWLFTLNPIAGLVQSFRAAIFRDVPFHAGHLALSAASIAALLVFGVFYFRRTERRFADIA